MGRRVDVRNVSFGPTRIVVKKEAIEAKAHAAEEAANKVEEDAANKVRASQRALGDAEAALEHEEVRLRQVRQEAEEKAAVEAATKAAAAQATAEAEAADLALRKNLHWAIGDRPTVARACHLYGDGLLFAAMGQESSFTIEACAADGIRQPTGGDKFVVVVRAAGQGRRFNGRVIDHGDGSYTERHAESERHSTLVEGGIVKPLGDFDTVLVGASALVITKDAAVDSLPIGQMAPGRELKLLKTMPFDLGKGMVLATTLRFSRPNRCPSRRLTSRGRQAPTSDGQPRD
ncbi:hypothetical protein Ctob_004693 [Chrysochromulina tobinii]|uniref:Uncharacterized protein n=1 Tax=Chrysochromulina tobinii TaxID=1460289 RepID=A0A0M0JSQ4_9EUKA|nr:hypothetical protein Ctob_004693 [Chrysochromulina tobinii]|eukprot:KOO29218.1 hypothetical protein Ctob_004693 [Chrysochromulina sp. CCMP291]